MGSDILTDEWENDAPPAGSWEERCMALLEEAPTFPDGCVLHVVGPLQQADAADADRPQPALTAVLKAAVALRECPIRIHGVLGATSSSRQAIATVQGLIDAIGDLRESVPFVCSVRYATLMGRDYADGADVAKLAEAVDAVVNAAHATQASSIASIEGFYGQGLGDRQLPPRTFELRGLRPGDAVVLLPDPTGAAAGLARALAGEGEPSSTASASPSSIPPLSLFARLEV